MVFKFIDCKYEKECRDWDSEKCRVCEHNKKALKSFFKPMKGVEIK